jgi:hypothetical protein
VAVAAGVGTVFDGFTSAHLPWRHPRYSRRERRSVSVSHVVRTPGAEDLIHAPA